MEADEMPFGTLTLEYSEVIASPSVHLEELIVCDLEGNHYDLLAHRLGGEFTPSASKRLPDGRWRHIWHLIGIPCPSESIRRLFSGEEARVEFDWIGLAERDVTLSRLTKRLTDL
jgi:hypothetical protein